MGGDPVDLIRNRRVNLQQNRIWCIMQKYLKLTNDTFKPPILDVGSGDSHQRRRLRTLYGTDLYVFDHDLDDIPYLAAYSNRFKTIISTEVLEHLYNPLFHLKELRYVLHPAGNLYLTTPNDYSIIYKAEHLLSRKYRAHFHQFSERDLRDILTRAGFRIIHLQKFRRSPCGTLARISRNGLFIHCRK